MGLLHSRVRFLQVPWGLSNQFLLIEVGRCCKALAYFFCFRNNVYFHVVKIIFVTYSHFVGYGHFGYSVLGLAYAGSLYFLERCEVDRENFTYIGRMCCGFSSFCW